MVATWRLGQRPLTVLTMTLAAASAPSLHAGQLPGAEQSTVGAFVEHEQHDDEHNEDFTPIAQRSTFIAVSSVAQPVHYFTGYRLDLSRWPPTVYIQVVLK